LCRIFTSLIARTVTGILLPVKMTAEKLRHLQNPSPNISGFGETLKNHRTDSYGRNLPGLEAAT
jgi:hypothetical protein